MFRIDKVLFMLLPFLGVMIDSAFSYSALSWVLVSLPETFSNTYLVFLASSAVVIFELLFGISKELHLKALAYCAVLFIPMLSLGETFSRYSESVMMGFPPADQLRVICMQIAQILIEIAVHSLILAKAPLILSLYNGRWTDYMNRPDEAVFFGDSHRYERKDTVPHTSFGRKRTGTSFSSP